MKRVLLLIGVCLVPLLHQAQKKDPAWDNTTSNVWTSDFSLVEIKSSIDGSLQKAWYHKTTKHSPQPLIVSLHTWSGDYNQEDPLAQEVLLRDWNYIHPDFRGANNKPEACGSPLVLADLEDAIAYAIKNGFTDAANVHIIGVSGGGYATLLAYMKLKFPVKSFNAWASISDLDSWYWESKGRAAKYATDIEQVVMLNGILNRVELLKRSPLYLSVPTQRKGAQLNIYAGIHDGYTGSVPITHSLLFYNRLASLLFPKRKNNIVADSTIISLLTKRTNPYADTSKKINNRIIHLYKQLPGLTLTVFEGGHEMLVPSALVLPPIDENKNSVPLHILTIGDSNGAFEYGWPQQMMKLLPYSTVINFSISGNTIGFDNLGQEKLNTCKNIFNYLDKAFQHLPKGKNLDYIFLGIGTNDTKVVFKERQGEVLKNMNLLISEIKRYFEEKKLQHPIICIISAPPMDEEKVDAQKYGGGNNRVVQNNSELKKIAANNNIDFLDTYTTISRQFFSKTSDGIHLNAYAQFELASIIIRFINAKQK